VRGKEDAESAAKVAHILDIARPESLTAEDRARVSVVRGDITQDRLGLSAARFDELAGVATRVIHDAATVDWAAPLETTRRINVDGTRRVLELAQSGYRRGTLRRFDYISTCHVCGKRTGNILEASLDDSAGFFNNYEQSKFEAETLVRRSGVPFSTFRLSSVVGDSRTGYSSTFRVMYWPLKMLSRGMAWVVPADRAGVLDIVPIDFVCEALEALSADPSMRGKTFHLAAGPERSSTIGELLDLAVSRFRVRPPMLISPSTFDTYLRPLLYLVTWGRRRDMMKKGRVYRPYMAFRASFDTAEGRSVLDPLGIQPPLVREYFQRLIDYALESNWGKREVEVA
jgi:long-chain acyl-CoA synthetase